MTLSSALRILDIKDSIALAASEKDLRFHHVLYSQRELREWFDLKRIEVVRAVPNVYFYSEGINWGFVVKFDKNFKHNKTLYGDLKKGWHHYDR